MRWCIKCKEPSDWLMASTETLVPFLLFLLCTQHRRCLRAGPKLITYPQVTSWRAIYCFCSDSWLVQVTSWAPCKRHLAEVPSGRENRTKNKIHLLGLTPSSAITSDLTLCTKNPRTATKIQHSQTMKKKKKVKFCRVLKIRPGTK